MEEKVIVINIKGNKMNKDKRLNLRLTKNGYKQVKKRMKLLDLNFSDYMRMLIFNDLKKYYIIEE